MEKSIRIIEFNETRKTCAKALASAGYTRYLRVVGSRAVLDAALAEGESQVALATGSEAVVRNNAELLILHGRHIRHLAKVRRLEHSRFVALSSGLSLALFLGCFLALLQCLAGRLSAPFFFRFGRKGWLPEGLIVFPLRRQRRQSARRYLPFNIGVSGFLLELRRLNVKYVVLRWFESLPHVEPGEDLDILVADDDLQALESVLDAWPGIQPVDLYTATGLPSTDFVKMAYYPPRLAAQILDSRVVLRELCDVPAREQYFYSLAYHALYHKGYSSGLPVRDGGDSKVADPEHDYTAVLASLAAELDVPVRINMASLDGFLEARGWKPPYDTLVRLAQHNRWIKETLVQPGEFDDGLAVFIIREAAMSQGRGGIPRIERELMRHGFHVCLSRELSQTVAAKAKDAIRGGNWGAGPWPVSGGVPVAVIVAYDVMPKSPSQAELSKYPMLRNARILCKDRIRDLLNEGVPPEAKCNPLHSSDSGWEGLEYLRLTVPDAEPEVLAQIEKLKQAFKTNYPVRSVLTKQGRRAKIEVIEYEGGLAVKKTFRQHQVRYLEREVAAMRELSKSITAVPPVLVEGETWFIMPYYADTLKYRWISGRMLPLGVARAAIRSLKEIYDAGFAMIDASTENIVIDPVQGFKLVDFEYCHRYTIKPTTFHESYDIAGCPPDFVGDLPTRGANTFERDWLPYIGVSVKDLLGNSSFAFLEIKRGLYYVAHARRFLTWRARSLSRRLRNKPQ